ncbi:hypothetical protein [Amycolatopsis albispora]|uniref:Uncharacterized protein n=1 Tax=Amycolatopsis albispora TaxID=1804986 RepID=A0A344L8U7_9PSEU|nr:hypothetical protein [Amycolatopsis albispora]AXB44471.1 hypothetical protein A4R43_19755 [Amycolatopsis albispora]
MTVAVERRGRTVLGVVRAFVTAHAAGIFLQPVFAGSYLFGDYDMLALHALGADVVFYIGLAQLVPTALLWRRTGVRWPFWGSVLLVLGETGQYAAGLDGALDLHVPLGVALAALAAVMAVASWRAPR